MIKPLSAACLIALSVSVAAHATDAKPQPADETYAAAVRD